MSYFPAFIKFDDKRVLIVGGGNIALEKLEHLLNFSKNITLIAKEFNSEVKQIVDEQNLKFAVKEYEKGDIKDFDIVIAAVDDKALQESIYFETRDYKILCNCVDYKQYCDFIFPAYIKQGDLTIAISTSGTSPAFAKNFKEYIKNLIPSGVEEFLKELKELRTTMPKGKERMRFLDNKVKDFLKSKESR
ncbi:precorrin-2 dehydrogenase/sirohydrochlorin ferrochelatase family protein [Aliarcobacter skirrowii]|uniref:precorrin-2 dehydrogenase/sirohydrochlorin ferrochelatase family protein n=1 Tax=Aliarcobacter skirrowii TaxID=28200 RepID=UPI0029A47E21|nr:bifunctional precorrin-2 dehydrogenase/sirohydrochlorin ferrochelatase [Aliarcobacter skirrowii]MDX4037955.1 bifunctional precorrin-2 dehydrogenase/sirohydrochlorin ferrochelatase [Aliarcobacter skirrowii]MDX4058261.1 bifunctional precorrin-2 dehydrogenase/sirohydrochlorin ferrochelatase [Aliarcobacter skirrowii]